MRMRALRCVQALNLPQCYIAAGFIRNLVWDAMHQSPPSELNDIDVIYYDLDDTRVEREQYLEGLLQKTMPEITWQVRNQARMHEKHQDPAYASTLDAMRFWPEKETAIAVRLDMNQRCEIIAAFGVQSLLELKLSHNPARPWAVFQQRIDDKQWLTHWPKLTVTTQCSVAANPIDVE
ncbi:nucleotidyltransferase family protein [Salinivibrio socompensis]|uniref:nucleotidyltransferase family protein n=2 Tax=Salinivibrio socompensis TaxID=1510206 RepID=UPI000686EDA8|nr:nucleotidyltransferase family protein [Salinivibrio socompensis]